MCKSKMIKKLIDVYMVMVLLGILLWLPFPDAGHIIGASSIIQAFLIAVGDTAQWIKYLSLSWILIFCFFLIWSYIVACKKNKYKPVILLMGIELIIAGIIIVYFILCWYSEYLFIMLTGYIIRFLYFMLVVYNHAIARITIKK